MEERLLLAPPGPVEEILALGDLLQIKDVVLGVCTLFDSASPELRLKGKQTADALVGLVETEITKRISEFRRKSCAAV